MVGRGDWIEHGVEEKFLFSTTSFPDKDEVKTFLAKVFSEANWQLGNERRPIILVGHGVYQDYNIVKNSFGVDLHTLDVVDIIQSKCIVKDAGLVPEGGSVSLPNLLKIFGLGPTELALRNASNDAVATLLVGLLASLHDKIHPDGSRGPVDLVDGRQGRSIILVDLENLEGHECASSLMG